MGCNTQRTGQADLWAADRPWPVVRARRQSARLHIQSSRGHRQRQRDRALARTQLLRRRSQYVDPPRLVLPSPGGAPLARAPHEDLPQLGRPQWLFQPEHTPDAQRQVRSARRGATQGVGDALRAAFATDLAAGLKPVRTDRPAGNQCEFTLELGQTRDVHYVELREPSRWASAYPAIA